MRPSAEGIDDEIEVAIPVHIGESSACGVEVRAGDPGAFRDLLESPMAEIAIEAIRSVEAAEVKITPAIAIDVAGGDARAVEEDLIGQMALFGEDVGETDSSGLG